MEKELVDKAKAGELKSRPLAPVQKRGRWDETPKTEVLGAGALTPSSQTPGTTQRQRLTISSNISSIADVSCLIILFLLWNCFRH